MEMNHVLVVEDDKEIREGVEIYLKSQGYEVFQAADGIEGLEVIEKEEIHLAIVDIMMPRMDGIRMTMKLREKYDFPVIMLSARGEEYDKIHGFELGIDDYVVKPFSPKELMMRVKVVIDRNGGRDSASTNGHEIFQAEGLVIDFTGRTVTVDGKRAELSPKEYDLLFYLVRNRNIALEREKLITEVWGYDYYGDDRTLDTHIKLLRSSLGDYRKFLVTLRGVGYRFEA